MLPSFFVLDLLSIEQRWIVFVIVGVHLLIVNTKRILAFFKLTTRNEYWFFFSILVVSSVLAYAFSEPETRLYYFFVFVTYPLISVPLQELFFRLFFFKRYKFMPSYLKRSINVLGFAYFHAIYGNYEAVLITFFGGILFTEVYVRTKSFKLVCVLHSFFGVLIFVSGYMNSFTDLFK